MWFQNQQNKEKRENLNDNLEAEKPEKEKIYVCNQTRVIEQKNHEENHNAISLVSCIVLFNKSFHYRF